jgi:hypothetical protein
VNREDQSKGKRKRKKNARSLRTRKALVENSGKENTLQAGGVYAQERHLWKTPPEDTAGRVLYDEKEANRTY